jgi:hypothetical protein
MADNPNVLVVHREVLSESKFPNKSSLDKIAKHLRSIRATGKLTIHFSQGGVNTVTFEARHTLNGYDHIELKFEGD